MALHALPRLPAVGERGDGLGAGTRRLLLCAIVLLHAGIGWGLLQVREVREAVVQAAPIFIDLIAPAAPPVPELPAPQLPPPQPTAPKPVPQKPKPVVQKRAPAKPRPSPPPVIAAPPAPAAALPAVPAEPPAPVSPVEAAPVVSAPPVQPQVAAPPAPVTPAVAAPRELPSSAVQYLEPPVVEYPRVSLRRRESGRVMLRVHIDVGGVPREIEVQASSGHALLDAAAVRAVRRARFKPYTEGGAPAAGWAYIPLDFELEKS